MLLIPIGELTALPSDPLSWIKEEGQREKGVEREEMEEEGEIVVHLISIGPVEWLHTDTPTTII